VVVDVGVEVNEEEFCNWDWFEFTEDISRTA
jgi:hypothetical protein